MSIFLLSGEVLRRRLHPHFEMCGNSGQFITLLSL